MPRFDMSVRDFKKLVEDYLTDRPKDDQDALIDKGFIMEVLEEAYYDMELSEREAPVSNSGAPTTRGPKGREWKRNKARYEQMKAIAWPVSSMSRIKSQVRDQWRGASRTLTASDRSALIRLASELPKGSTERKTILAGLSKKANVDEMYAIVIGDGYLYAATD